MTAMPLPEFSPVRLLTDRYLSSEGIGRGAIGFILDVVEDAYRVEFSRPEDGTNIAWFFLQPEDIESTPEAMQGSVQTE